MILHTITCEKTAPVSCVFCFFSSAIFLQYIEFNRWFLAHLKVNGWWNKICVRLWSNFAPPLCEFKNPCLTGHMTSPEWQEIKQVKTVALLQTPLNKKNDYNRTRWVWREGACLEIHPTHQCPGCCLRLRTSTPIDKMEIAVPQLVNSGNSRVM